MAVFGMHADYLHVGVLFLQIRSHTRDGATGAQRCHKVGDFALGLFPNLGARGEKVCLGVGFVAILVEHVKV